MTRFSIDCKRFSKYIENLTELYVTEIYMEMKTKFCFTDTLNMKIMMTVSYSLKTIARQRKACDLTFK